MTEVAALSGEELLRSCEVVLQSAKRVGTDKTWVPHEGSQCWYYLEAVLDMTRLVEPSECKMLPCKSPMLRICLPEDVSFTQIIRVYVNEAQKNPKLLHLYASGLAVAALREAFPCQ
jgi:hypothetical protein